MMNTHLETNSATNSQLTSIDNLGEGHCGYISFIIGALHLAKNGQAPHFLTRWKELDGKISPYLENALKLELSKLSNDRNYIIPLVYSLRKILCQYYLQSLPSHQETRNYQYFSMPDKNMILDEFSHLCRHAIHVKTKKSDMTGEFVNMRYNNLWYDQQMRQIAKEVAELALRYCVPIENEKTLTIFLFAALVYHHDAVERSYRKWSESQIWMTDRQAFQLSEIFNIPVVISTHCRRPEGGFIHLKNKVNRHWTVLLYDDKYPYRFQELTTEQKFRDLESTYFSENMRSIFRNDSYRDEMVRHIPSIQKYLDQYKNKLDELETDYHQDREKFITNIENERFFSLFRNCIEAKDNIIEFQIESSKLLMYLDKENADKYKYSLNLSMNKRYAMTEDEKLLFDQYVEYFRKKKNDLLDGDDSLDSMSDTELVDEFLKETECYSYIGFWIGAVLSTIAAIALIVSSFDLIGPAIICIVLGTIFGFLLGKSFDLLFGNLPSFEINNTLKNRY